jgi:carbamoyl-phosphate synthase large subunit
MCRTRSDAVRLAAHYPDSVLQEALEPADQEVTCGVYRTRGGAVAVVALRRELAGGATVFAEVVTDPEVRKQCVVLAEGLGLQGSINVQLIRTGAGPRIFEINARFSSTVAMRDRLGFTDVKWALDEALLGRAADILEPEPGAVVFRVPDVQVRRPQ